jgi:hypothetical protein
LIRNRPNLDEKKRGREGKIYDADRCAALRCAAAALSLYCTATATASGTRKDQGSRSEPSESDSGLRNPLRIPSASAAPNNNNNNNNNQNSKLETRRSFTLLLLYFTPYPYHDVRIIFNSFRIGRKPRHSTPAVTFYYTGIPGYAIVLSSGGQDATRSTSTVVASEKHAPPTRCHARTHARTHAARCTYTYPPTINVMA